MNSLISDILFGFTGLISIINPLGVAFVFYDRTAALTESERRQIARRVAVNAFVVLLVAFFAGAPVLHFFGISIEALRIGGGLAVAVAGWQMLNAPDMQTAGTRHDAAHLNAEAASSKAFFPLTVPLTTGPGAIATAIALTANRASHKLPTFLLSAVSSVVISVLVMAAIYLIYSRAARLAHYLGVAGTRVALRVSSFLLLCIGVQIILTGVEGFLAPIVSAHGAG
ncbi:MAG: NAAT family transporter [Burkholderiaceae bacterium]|jgi:multiple antibiotic resistance protein|nr:NAAT family transporter [Burkholderiaceae bacterium]